MSRKAVRVHRHCGARIVADSYRPRCRKWLVGEAIDLVSRRTGKVSGGKTLHDNDIQRIAGLKENMRAAQLNVETAQVAVERARERYYDAVWSLVAALEALALGEGR